MRSAGNFSPEWGYLAPAPSFMRTARVVLVATAIGATAGAAVVLSLIDRPVVEGEKSLVAAHAIVTSAQASTITMMPATPTPMAAAAPAMTSIPATNPVAQVRTPPQPVQSTAILAAPQTTATITPPAAISPAGSASIAEPAAMPQQSSSGIAALSDPSSTSDAARSDLPDGAALAPETPPAKKSSKHSGAASAKNLPSQPNPGLGSALRRLFSAHAGTSYYPAR
jgi:hypothetical protein